jgi:triosephosphate isomerase
MVAGNWKMNGTRASVRALAGAVAAAAAGDAAAEVDIVLAPAVVHLADVAACIAGSAIALAAQDVSAHDAGAYTGEIAAPMLVEFGARHAIVGHSERRQYHGETDAAVAAKFIAAQRAGLVPILCVGETLAERDAGYTEAVVARQLGAVLDAAGVAAFAHAVLAYEPVWAIGTGRTASSAQAQAVHAVLRSQVAAADAKIAGSLRILYGGSVKAANAAGLFAEPDVDGGLVGGASLDAAEFMAIVAAAHVAR